MKQFKITGFSVLLILLAILIIVVAIIIVVIKIFILFLPIILILIAAYLIYRFLFVKQFANHNNKNYGFSDIKIKINNKFRKHKHSKKTSDKKVIDATYREKK